MATVRKRRGGFEVFSVSFLDCICCGFGAMLLLFVLTIGKQADERSTIVARIQVMISQLEADISREEKETDAVHDRLRIRNERIDTERAKLETTKSNITSLEEQLALVLQQRSSLRDQLDRLLAREKEIPKEDVPAPIPIPNVQRRQYLTGFNFEGDYVVFMIEASGGMMAESIDQAMAMLTLPDEEKRQSIKWRRVVRSVQWIIANLRPTQVYQILVFNQDATALIPEREHEWFKPGDRETTIEVLRRLAELTPKGGANHERAFSTVREIFPSVDGIMLLTDGLPTLSDSIPSGSVTTDSDRERFMRAALRVVPRQTPVNTILYPMTGDPAATFLYWQLADVSKGALITPAPSWPDI
ncbi:hypothetical protein ASA1KI_38380 [Opitutales bacterium ASA1]|uniref:hypothetical protein n=1 Tax=Congregicoccus parvus TaxID=3081749 RepID=UPI002B2CC17A|nr:hypothetical protein ASA1KI_38380 [Opitutales bacterium ASA1]